jgi:hypothetical protein
VEHLMEVTLIGLVSGIIGTGIGGLLAYFKYNNGVLCGADDFSSMF